MDDIHRHLEEIPGYDPGHDPGYDPGYKRRAASRPLFPLGALQITPAALEAFANVYGAADPAHAEPFLSDHAAALWPTLTAHERELNLSAIEHGYAINSRYVLSSNKALALYTAGETSIKHRPFTTVDVAATTTFLVARDPSGDPSGRARILTEDFQTESGYFPSPREAIEAFTTRVRQRPTYLPADHLVFVDFETRDVLAHN